MSGNAYACREHLFKQIQIAHESTRITQNDCWYINPEADTRWVCEYGTDDHYCRQPAHFSYKFKSTPGAKLILKYGPPMETNIYRVEATSSAFVQIVEWCRTLDVIYAVTETYLQFIYTGIDFEGELGKAGISIQTIETQEFYKILVKLY